MESSAQEERLTLDIIMDSSSILTGKKVGTAAGK
jgi:hypothetical protein